MREPWPDPQLCDGPAVRALKGSSASTAATYSPCGSLSFALISRRPISRNALCARFQSREISETYSSACCGSDLAICSAWTRASSSIRTGGGRTSSLSRRDMLLPLHHVPSPHLALHVAPHGLYLVRSRMARHVD